MGALEITAIILASLSVGFLISHVILLEGLFRHFFGRMEADKMENDPLTSDYYDISRERLLQAREEIKKIPYREVAVTAADGARLVANYYDLGKENTVIFMHGFHSHPFSTFSTLALSMMEKGYNVLFPFERAHAKSGGKYITYGWKEQYDLLKWIDFVDTETTAKNVLVYGVSMGGTTVGLASDKIACPKVKALVVDCAFTGIDSLLDNLVKTMHLPGKIFLPGMKRRIKRRMGMTLDQFDMTDSIRNDKLPTFFVYGEKDFLVSRESFDETYAACPAEKEAFIAPESGHAVTMVDGGEAALDKLYAFVDRFIDR